MAIYLSLADGDILPIGGGRISIIGRGPPNMGREGIIILGRESPGRLGIPGIPGRPGSPGRGGREAGSAILLVSEPAPFIP